MPPPDHQAGRAYVCHHWLAALAIAACAMSSVACGKNSGIVLVVDTDMEVPFDVGDIHAEIDRVRLTIAGPTHTEGPFDVDLVPPAPPFPRTMGLVDSGSGSSVRVTVEGFRETMTAPFVTQRVTTNFVPDETRLLRIVLTAACLGVTCEDPTTVCGADGKCVPVDRPSRQLPQWSTTPPRPGPKPEEASLLWSAGWRSCAPWGGTLYCWGENDVGQMGNPGFAAVHPVLKRVPVVGLVPSPARPNTVALGYKHSCVCDASSGRVYCWGANENGQVGADGAAPKQLTPVAVPEITDCVSVAAGGAHTCVLRADTTVACWGLNDKGQTGQPASTAPVGRGPKMVSGLTAVQDLQAGEKYTCAATTNGTVQCWGDNTYGQLGDGTTTTRETPKRVMLPMNTSGAAVKVTELATGRYFACLRTATETVYCWGENSAGMVGVSAPANVTTPSQVPSITDALHIVAGHHHACALRRAGGKISCWGGSEYGQLGDGAGANSTTPVDVVDLPGPATAVAAGVVHTCARTAKAIFCWGQNVNGQVGDGTMVGTEENSPAVPRPVQVVGF